VTTIDENTGNVVRTEIFDYHSIKNIRADYEALEIIIDMLATGAHQFKVLPSSPEKKERFKGIVDSLSNGLLKWRLSQESAMGFGEGFVIGFVVTAIAASLLCLDAYVRK